MVDYEDALQDQREDALGSHLYSGDEWGLLAVEPEDFALPVTTSRLEILEVGYDGGLHEVARTMRSDDETMIEYEFALGISLEALMPEADAQSNEWPVESRSDIGLTLVRTRMDMIGRAGVVYEGDEVVGGIEFIGVRRADGTPPLPDGSLPDVDVIPTYQA
jgi:hypothetical protein